MKNYKVYFLLIWIIMSCNSSNNFSVNKDTGKEKVTHSFIKGKDTLNTEAIPPTINSLCSLFYTRKVNCQYSSSYDEYASLNEFYVLPNASIDSIYQILQTERYDFHDSSFIPLNFRLKNYNNYQNTTFSTVSQRVIRSQSQIDSILLTFHFDGGLTFINFIQLERKKGTKIAVIYSPD